MGSIDNHITTDIIPTRVSNKDEGSLQSNGVRFSDHDKFEKKQHRDERSSPAVKRILYSLTAIAILGGLYHLWTEPIVIHAPFGQTITTALPDHSIVELNSGTTLTYKRSFGWVDRKVRLNGEAFFTVKGSSQPFQVITSNSIMSSVNTKFNVRSWSSDPGNETVVTLIEGKLDFAAKTDPDNQITLLSGQTSRVVGNNHVPTQPQIANVVHTVSWRQKGLSFDSQPLSVIFGEMERRYNIMIKTSNPQILSDSLTIFIARPTGPRDVLNNICQAANLKYDSTNKGFLVSRN